MSPELANRATILAAQYAGNSTEMLYPPQIGIWIIGGIIFFLVILLAVGSYIFDKIGDRKLTPFRVWVRPAVRNVRNK